MLDQAIPLKIQTPWEVLGGEQCSPPSLHLAVPKSRGLVIYVYMNGNRLLPGNQGINKQVKMRFCADEIQLVNKEDVVKSM